MFAHDRDPGKVVDLSARRRQLKPADSLRDEPKMHELEAERRERLDNGDRTVVAMRFDGLGSSEPSDAQLVAERERIDAEWEVWMDKQAPLTEEEARQKVARHVDEARAKLLAAAKVVAERDDLQGLHARLASVALDVDTLLSDLADQGDAA